MRRSKRRLEAGLEIRKQALGEDYIERSLGNANAFTMALKEFVTEVAWVRAWSKSSRRGSLGGARR